MPANIRNVVERAVRARQRCSECFRTSGVDNPYTDKQHIDFIGIFEQLMNIIETCMESSGSVPARQNHRGYVEPNTSISNRFSSLEMEERPDVDPVDVSEIATAVEIPTQTNASKTDPEIAAYEVNDEDEWDDE